MSTDDTLEHYLQEVDHAAEQILKLEKAIFEAVGQSSPEIRSVIEALQALRGVAQITAATIVCELGSLSRFQSPRQLMGYSGWCRGNIPVETAFNEGPSLRPAMPTSAPLPCRPV